jgi:hypothetical protein
MTYDLTKFDGELVVDIMRTHPLVIVGGILQENPVLCTSRRILARAVRTAPTRLDRRS